MKTEILKVMQSLVEVNSNGYFQQDYLLVRRIKRAVEKFTEDGVLNERELLNMLITLGNKYQGTMVDILTIVIKDDMKYINPFLMILGWVGEDVEVSPYSVEIAESLIAEMKLAERDYFLK